MAIIDIPKRERKAVINFFTFSKTSSSSPRSPPSTPSHMFSESTMDENINNAQSMVTKWGPNGPPSMKPISLFQENRREAREFVKCVKELRQAMHFLVSENSGSCKLVVAQNLMQIAMKRLEKEFYHILTANRKYLDPESVSNVEPLSVVAISDLRLIADCMISSGYGGECVKIYKVIRRSIVEEALYHYGIKQYSSSQINKMNSEVYERNIKNWLNAIKIAVKTLFHGERFLCDHVFSTSETIRESCFADISKGVINLFKFPELIAKNKRSPEKIFQLLDLYEAISSLLPEIESIFSYKSLSATIRVQILSSLIKLGESVQIILSKFESSIQKSSSKTPITGGQIHPLTNSVMTYIEFLANYSGVLTDIIADSPMPEQSPLLESYLDSPNSSESPMPAVSLRFSRIILVLLCKLDSKVEDYNNISLSYLFLANNLQYIVEKVRTTNLKNLLGEEWVSKHGRKVKQYAASYEAMAWSKVLSCLPKNSAAAMSMETVKGCFKQFNSAFEDAYRKQTSWVVTDKKLRDEIKVSIAKKLVPAYQDFYDTYLVTLSGEKNLEVLVTLAPDDLGNYLSDLFHGADASGSSLLSSSSSSHSSRCLPYI